MSRPAAISTAARKDIAAIYDYIVQKSPQNARNVVEKLYDQFEKIDLTPGIGHTRSELNDDSLRVIAVFSYLVIYDPTRKPLEIVRVIHGAMELDEEFHRE